jgi:Putative adhesin
MKTKKISFFFFALIISMSQLMAQKGTTQTQQLVVPLSEPGKPYKLEAHLFHGSIKVTGYEGKEIVIDVEADTSEEKGDNEEAHGMKRIPSGGGLDVKAEEENNTVKVNAGMSKKLVGVNIKVPREGGTLKLSTVEDGDVSVTDVSGEVEVNNTNGDVTLKGISGSIVASALNGTLIAELKKVDPKAEMAFSTLNGKIDVTFPADIKANLKLKTENGGDMYTDFDIPADQTQPRMTKTAENHSYRVNIDNWVTAKINGGGPEIMMKSFQGDIYIRKAK